MDRNRDDEVQVVALAPKQRELLDVDRDVEGAVLLAGDGDVLRTAAHRLFEGERQRLVKIDAALGDVASASLALVQHLGEQIAEGRRRGAADADGEIESLEPERPFAGRPDRRV